MNLLTPQLLNKKNQQGLGQLASFAIVIFWCVLVGLVMLNRQNIFDRWRLWHYHAPVAIAQLATQDTMTSYARKVFYVNEPAIDQKASFAAPCPNNGGEQTIVLGCYHSNQKGIFLLSVNDPRLDGVEQVTAAHEMLHAAYDRLSKNERDQVDGWLMDYYKHDLKDPRLIATMDSYKKTEPTEVVNEMHSVFGTEVANLPSKLEKYYRRYFTDRSKVTAYAAAYQGEFTSRQNTISRDDAQLSTWKAQITAKESDLKTKLSQLNAEQSKLLGEKNRGDYTDYNNGVPTYNGLVNSYNSEVSSLKALINQYNQLVVSRNAVALEQDQLANELSNNTKPINQ
ncbi:MAG TPA: hypothetical protein VG604_04610 [Candidatus Saccharimonadales bacterium]|nr:hypothetical protein [Candidatus Saccharimonadales bacterium]